MFTTAPSNTSSALKVCTKKDYPDTKNINMPEISSNIS